MALERVELARSRWGDSGPEPWLVEPPTHGACVKRDCVGDLPYAESAKVAGIDLNIIREPNDGY